MSRVGKEPIKVENIEVIKKDNIITFKGKNGQLAHKIPEGITITNENNILYVNVKDSKNKKLKSLWGTTRSILNNIVVGLLNGFSENIVLEGVGYKSSLDGKILGLFIGLSHEIKIEIPEDIKVVCLKPTLIQVSGYSKEAVKSFASKIKHIHNNIRIPEPYKGKGIRYEGEFVLRKEGKNK